MKIIEINCCNECPYCESILDVFVEGGHYCNHPRFERMKKISPYLVGKIKIPEWCLLKEKT